MGEREERIHLWTGPMCSGKTRALLETHQREGGLLLSFSGSRHKDGVVTSRDGPRAPATLVTRLDAAAFELVRGHRSVFVDEGQFFEDLAAFCVRCADSGVRVYVAALDLTWRREYWPAAAALVKVCDTVDILLARCECCDAPAEFSKRVSSSESTIDVDARYEPRCSVCWDK